MSPIREDELRSLKYTNRNRIRRYEIDSYQMSLLSISNLALRVPFMSSPYEYFFVDDGD